MHADGSANVWWTNAELNIIGTARNEEGNVRSLGAWWSDGQGPV